MSDELMNAWVEPTACSGVSWGGRMSTTPCPGCGGDRDSQVCCDECWDRPPTNIPNAPRWRSSRHRVARGYLGWGNEYFKAIERIDAALVTWLTAHPAASPGEES